MAIKVYKPTINSRRNMSVTDYSGLSKVEPEKSLLAPLNKKAGRNSYGRITVRHRGGGNRKKYRIIDFKRQKFDVEGTVKTLEYDPNRSAFIALVEYTDGEKAYIIAPEEYKMEFVQVVSVENMRKSDARTIAEHTPSAELMYRAAQGIFNSAKFVGRVAIVCGKGNNGGDGYALACVLCKNGFTPTIFRASDGFSKDGLYYYKTAMSLGAEEMPMSQAAAFTGFDIVVDCLLGTGFSGELKGEMLEAVEQINMTNAYVISADINSGINGDTGVCSTAVNSDLTVSIGSFKTGLFLNDAPYYIGSVTNCDIGISLIEDEYKLIDYSLLHMFEGYGSLVMTAEEFFEKYGYEPSRCNVARCVEEISKKERRTVVVKTDHSAVIADLKYIYFCADYVINN